MTSCSDCASARAVVECCGAPLCWAHVHCTTHAAHPSLWRVTDATAKAAQEAAVLAMRTEVIAALERDCARAVRDAEAAPAARAATHAPRGPVSRVTPAAAPALAALPRPRAPRLTVSEVRARAIADAQARLAATSGGRGVVASPDGGDRGSAIDGGEESGDDDEPSKRIRTKPRSMWSVPVAAAAAAAAAAHPTSTALQPAAAAALVPPRVAASMDIPETGGASDDDSASLRASVVALLSRALHAGAARDAALAAATAAPPAAAAAASGALDRLAALEAAAALELSPPAAAHLAAALEGAIARAHGPASVEYRARARAMAHALADPRNAALRAQLSAGDVAPAALATAPLDELASAEERAARRVLAEPPRVDDGEWLPAALRCPSCAVDDAEYQHRAQQRDIRKAEVWGSGDSGDSSMRVRCRRCGAEWNREAL